MEGSGNYLILFGVMFVFFSAVFLVAQRMRNNGLIDIAWGLGFVCSTLISFAIGNPQSIVPQVATACVLAWGLRLTWHLAGRNLGKPEDFRYARMRDTWNPRTFHLRMFVQIYLLQLFLNVLINLPTIVSNLQDVPGWNAVASAGLAVWCIGFFFEVVGDHQLKVFKAKPANNGKLIETGLWRYTRHPNYFGEAVQWWGIFLLAVSAGYGYWLVISPLAITFFLLYVSGVPMLERKYEGRADWEDYKRRTRRFFPGIPKK